MSEAATNANILNQLFTFSASVIGAGETTIGGMLDSRSASTTTSRQAANVEIAQGTASFASIILSERGTVTDSTYLSSLGTVIGAGSAASTAIQTLPQQMDSLSASMFTYDAAVASGDTGAISSSGLSLTAGVAAVLNSVGTVIASGADVLSATGVISASAAAPMISLGLAISSAAGLFALSATNAVVDAIKDAANSISHLLDSIASQSGTGGPSDSTQTGAPNTGGTPPESGAGGSAMRKYEETYHQVSPLVLDLNGTGIDLTPLNTSSPYFDLTNDGFARQTGWIGAGMGLLSFDPDDRNITNITQLFGNATTDGFDVLRKLDTNHDNIIDASDAAYASLRVWVDANGNGTTELGELYTLTQLGIASIDLNATMVQQTIAGNTISSVSSFTLTDGTTHEIADAWFSNSTMNTKPVAPVEVSATAAVLPQIAGAGSLRDLHSAMTLDQNLQDLVKAFVAQPASTTPFNLESATKAILFQWAGVTQADPASRGGMIDARQLGFVERYLGRPFNTTGDGANPGVRAAAYVELAWNDLYDAAMARLVLQSPSAASVAPEFKYDATSNTVQASATLAPAMAAAFQRLGSITATNLDSWDLLLRVADAARLDMGMPVSLFKKYVAAATNDTVASVANAIASGLQFSIDGSGRIQESGATIYHDFYAGPGISLLAADHVGNDPAAELSGQDIFNYSAGDGVVEIHERDPNSATPHNVLKLGIGINASSLAAKGLSNGNIVLTDGITGDQITLDAQLVGGGWGVQELQFADGTTWTAQQLVQLAAICGTAGNDTLYGTSGAEVFDGRGGNDVEMGGGGGDTFLYHAGYGKLEIYESDNSSNPYNVLQLGMGISKESVTVRGTSGGSLVLTDGVAGDEITLDMSMLLNSMGVQAVRFADNTIWTREQLIQMATTGTAGNDTLYGAISAEIFDGKGGNDYIQGEGGGDTFIFNAGYGKLEIAETDHSSAPHNELQLGAGINASSVTVKGTSGGSLLLTDGIAGDEITLDGELASSGSGVQTVRFADGTTWTRQQLLRMATTGTTGADSLYGTIGADVFDGRGGNDYAQGLGGGDTFIFNAGYGKLEIDEHDSAVSPHNVLQLGAGINASAVTVKSTSGGSLVLTDGIAGDQITLDSAMNNNNSGVQAVQFADGTTWTRQQLIQMATTSSPLGAVNANGESPASQAPDAQTSQLIQAMAMFAVNSAGFDSMRSDNPMIDTPMLLAAAPIGLLHAH